MTGCRALLSHFQPMSGGSVSFGNNEKGYITGSGIVENGNIKFNDVFLVENLKFNLLSVSQLADKNLCSFFNKDTCRIM